VDDKISVKAANVSHSTEKSYYGDFLSHPSHAIPTPTSNYISHTIAQEQMNELIDYIMDENMTIKAASRKANMTYNSAKKNTTSTM
jgi:hypothetical protein